MYPLQPFLLLEPRLLLGCEWRCLTWHSQTWEHVQGLCCWQSCEDGSSSRQGGKNFQGEWRMWSPATSCEFEQNAYCLFPAGHILTQAKAGKCSSPPRWDRNNSTFNQFFKQRDGTEHYRVGMDPSSILQAEELHVLLLSKGALSYQHLRVLYKEISMKAQRVLDPRFYCCLG